MKAIGLVLARLDSKRLPSKALTEMDGRPLLSFAVERARRARLLSDVIVATSTRPVDDPLVSYGHGIGVSVFRGSADNVAQRCIACARQNEADYFVRINGDSPFLDPTLIDQGLSMVNQGSEPDLVTNLIGRTFPYGISVEVINVTTMERIFRTFDKYEAEHVTKRFYDRPGEFHIQRMTSSSPQISSARLVVDTPEDLERCREIAKALGPRAFDAQYCEVAEIYLSIAEPSRRSDEAAFRSRTT